MRKDIPFSFVDINKGALSIHQDFVHKVVGLKTLFEKGNFTLEQAHQELTTNELFTSLPETQQIALVQFVADVNNFNMVAGSLFMEGDEQDKQIEDELNNLEDQMYKKTKEADIDDYFIVLIELALVERDLTPAKANRQYRFNDMLEAFPDNHLSLVEMVMIKSVFDLLETSEQDDPDEFKRFWFGQRD